VLRLQTSSSTGQILATARGQSVRGVAQGAAGQAQHIIQIQQPASAAQQAPQAQAQAQQAASTGIQLFQQVVTPSGEVQQVPVSKAFAENRRLHFPSRLSAALSLIEYSATQRGCCY